LVASLDTFRLQFRMRFSTSVRATYPGNQNLLNLIKRVFEHHIVVWISVTRNTPTCTRNVLLQVSCAKDGANYV